MTTAGQLAPLRVTPPRTSVTPASVGGVRLWLRQQRCGIPVEREDVAGAEVREVWEV